MFFRKKKLYESDPKSLSLEALSLLHASLTAKLLIISRELGKRYQSLALLSESLENAEQNRAILLEGAEREKGLSLILENILAQNVGKVSAKVSNADITQHKEIT